MSKNQASGSFTLTGFNDIFKTTTHPSTGESIVSLPIAELHMPEAHPFQVNDDEAMTRLSESIKRHGIQEPGIVRPREGGGYELLCGNRRKRACELLGLSTMPVIIRNMDDDSAVITMVDSNLEQREKLLPSEKASAYRMKLEALNHNGIKGDALSVDVLVEQTGESKNQIFRLIRLTELTVPLIDWVDTKRIAFNPAVELSYLSQKKQSAVALAMEKYDVKPSLSQAQKLKQMEKSGELTVELVDKILSEEKKPPNSEAPSVMKYRSFFPPGYSLKQMDETITRLLKAWGKGAAV